MGLQMTERLTQTIVLANPTATDSRTFRLNFAARLAIVDGRPCSLDGAMTIMHYFVSFGWSIKHEPAPKVVVKSPTLSAVRSNAQAANRGLTLLRELCGGTMPDWRDVSVTTMASSDASVVTL
jgi:hypothetical protein